LNQAEQSLSAKMAERQSLQNPEAVTDARAQLIACWAQYQAAWHEVPTITRKKEQCRVIKKTMKGLL